MKKLTLTLFSVLGIAAAGSVSADSAKLVNPANGHSYQRFDTAKTWQQAEFQCESLKGTLASITSQAENDWIVSQQLNSQDSWLGSTDRKKEGFWLGWVTEEAFIYTNWGSGQPDNGSGSEEDFLRIKTDGAWDDFGSSPEVKDSVETLSYICEWGKAAPVQKSIYTNIITIPDINGNSSSEFALLGVNKKDYTLTVIDSVSQNIISQSITVPKAGFVVQSISLANDSDNNGAPEVAILFNKAKDKSSVLMLQDTLTGAVLDTITLP